MGHYGAHSGVKNTDVWGDWAIERQIRPEPGCLSSAFTNSQWLMAWNWITAVCGHPPAAAFLLLFMLLLPLVTVVSTDRTRRGFFLEIQQIWRKGGGGVIEVKTWVKFSLVLGVFQYGWCIELLTWYPPITLKHNPSFRQVILSSKQ